MVCTPVRSIISPYKRTNHALSLTYVSYFVYFFNTCLFSAPLTASSKRTRLDLDSEGSEIDETEGLSSGDNSDDDVTISNTVVHVHKQTEKQTGKHF